MLPEHLPLLATNRMFLQVTRFSLFLASSFKGYLWSEAQINSRSYSTQSHALGQMNDGRAQNSVIYFRANNKRVYPCRPQNRTQTQSANLQTFMLLETLTTRRLLKTSSAKVTMGDASEGEVSVGAFTRQSFWARHSKRLARGPIALGTVRLIYTTKHVQFFSMLISETAPLKQERHS